MSPIYNNCYALGFCHLTCRMIDKRVPVRSRDRAWISSHSFRLCFLDFLPSVAYSTPVPLSTFICRSFFTRRNRHLQWPNCPLDSSATIRLEVCALATLEGGKKPSLTRICSVADVWGSQLRPLLKKCFRSFDGNASLRLSVMTPLTFLYLDSLLSQPW